MKIYKKRVKNTIYLVAKETVNIGRGKSIIINKSFGAEDTVRDIARKKLDFHIFVTEAELKARQEYWRKKVVDKDFLKYCSMDKIEQARTELVKTKSYMGRESDFLDTIFMVDFIYNSNKIEGSKLPRYAVENIVAEKEKRGNDEVINTVKAINRIKGSFRFNSKQIRSLHSILLSHESISHEFRREPIIVGNSPTIDWTRVKGEVDKLLKWYEEGKKTMYPPLLAFLFYLRFEFIHPFVDGNGRIGRLLMNRILSDHGYHPMIIWDKNRRSHFSAFKKAMDGRYSYYYKFMADQMTETYRVYLKKLKPINPPL